MSQNEMRIVLIGKTGSGKSSTGNSLLNSRGAFHATQSAQSITADCKSERYQHTDNSGQQKTLTVVDTPGFFDTNKANTNEIIEKKIASQIFQMTTPGVHAFLIVIRIGRFTSEEKNTVDFIRHIFGADAMKYCIVVFTAEDQLEEGQTLDEFIKTSSDLRELVGACNNRKFSINNKLNGSHLAQKTKGLIEIIDNMIRSNGGNYYTNAEYQRIERQRLEEQRRQEEAKRLRKKAEEDALIARTREEERKKGEQAKQKVREEEQRKAEQRERELISQLNAARNRNNDNDNTGSLLRALQSMGLGNGMSPMNQGMAMPCQPMNPGMSCSPMNSGMEMPMQRMGSARPGMGGAPGGRFTGEYMSTNGAANGRAIYEGALGGQYYMTPGGNKSYIRK